MPKRRCSSSSPLPAAESARNPPDKSPDDEKPDLSLVEPSDLRRMLQTQQHEAMARSPGGVNTAPTPQFFKIDDTYYGPLGPATYRTT